jgi:diacylglycerol kinase family enzyme
MSQQTVAAGPIPVFYNPRAGLGGQEDADPLAEALREAGVSAETRAVAPAQLAEAIAEAIGQGAPLIGVSGGDGTLVTAANALAGSSSVLCAFPSGTLNHFARRLGLEDLPVAARAIAQGETVQVPLGVMDDRLFLNTATFGLYADVVRRRERWRPILRKWPAAAVGFLQTLIGLRELTISMQVEGKQITCETPLVWVGVGWGSFPFVHESPDERSLPDLEIVIMRPGSRIGAIFLMLRMAISLRDKEKLRDDPALQFLHARQLVIHARRHIGVTLDGEVMRCDSPIYVGVQEGALSVRGPLIEVEGEERTL